MRMNKEDVNRVRHGLKRVANIIRLLIDEIDAVFLNIEETANKEDTNGNITESN